jgi:hypothetical protein
MVLKDSLQVSMFLGWVHHGLASIRFPLQCISTILPISWSCYQELNHYLSDLQPKESLFVNSMGKADNSYVQFTFAIHGPSYGPGYFLTGGYTSYY